MTPRFPERQTIMIDADDTLWENNVYFERALDRFVDLVAHTELSPIEVRSAFDQLEASRVKTHGYGTRAFHRSLVAGFQQLKGVACNEAEAAHLQACVEDVRSGTLELLDGVAETLPLLAERHRLILVTKGDYEEQVSKLQRSKLSEYFEHVEVLHEKHTGAYLSLLRHFRCDPERSWMVGNSPRSDTNPALRAGMHAIHLPHESTWSLEQEPMETPQPQRHLLQLSSFRELPAYFV